VRIRLDGAKEWDVSEYVREQEQTDGSPWNLAEDETPLSERQIRRYIEKADRLIDESTRESRKRALRRHLARREAMYAKAMNAGDIRTALAVAQDEAKLRGLYPAEKLTIKGKVKADLTVVELTDEQRRDAIAALLTRVGATGPRPDLAGAGDPARPAV
jgi:hypothetical protein